MEATTTYVVERKIGQSLFKFETGRLAMQADGAVLAHVGETVVLVAATASKSAREGTDFFPLTVDVEERLYAAGKIPGGVFRREGRPTEKATLTARLIDRPLRPCFDENLRNDIQIIVLVKAVDQIHPQDVISLNGASVALTLSGIPFNGPVGAVELAYVDGDWLVNPTYQQAGEGIFEMIVAGRRNSTGVIDILMIEAGANEQSLPRVAAGASEMTEELVAEGLEVAKPYIMEVIELQEELLRSAGVRPSKKKWVYAPSIGDDIWNSVSQTAREKMAKALKIADKLERETALDEVEAELLDSVEDNFSGRENEAREAIHKLTKTLVRERILSEGVRVDGRGLKEIRPVSSEVSVLPRVHGSGIFNRGQTQILSAVTLGMLKMEQIVGFDDLGIVESKRYMHHYNFPPFSTGETGRMGGPRRREIGHGALAERALVPVVPSDEEFPYALRVVSEVLSSNGSTSMGSVCGSTLALMDAGVPIKAPVAGISIGLVSAEGKWITLTDILGAEDAYGDMDFKVAGTENMVTAIQLDTKVPGVPSEVLARALQEARDARLFILAKMAETLPLPRAELNANAPRIMAIKIPIDKIGEVIGPKGKRINEIVATTGVEIDIEDDGTVRIGSREAGGAEAAQRMIEEIVNPRIPEVGERFKGTVVKITDFGAFVSLTPAKDGLVHISKLGGNIRLRRVEDVISVGDALEVEVAEVDPMGKISLVPASPPPRLAELPADYDQAPERPPRTGRPERDGRDRDRGGRGDRGGRDRGRPRRPHRDSGRDSGGDFRSDQS